MPEQHTPTTTTRYARWIHARVPGAIEPTMRLTLRAGRAGTGTQLGLGVEYWMESAKSMDEADRFCAAIEADARAAGYTVLPDAEQEDET